MAPVIFYSVYAVVVMVSVVSGGEGGTCQACNCRLNNAEVLNQLIESKIASAAISGVTYTRWGRTSCPNDTNAQLVYSGRAGGTWFSIQGGSAEKICLPDDPDYIPNSINIYSSGVRSVVHGAEYQVNIIGNPLQHLFNHNVPCAVCDVPTRARVIMVPAKTVCPPSWTREYYGYLMTAHDSHHRSSYSCVDVDAEPIPGTASNTNGVYFYHTITVCNGLLCSPYENNRQLSCVVCTK